MNPILATRHPQGAPPGTNPAGSESDRGVMDRSVAVPTPDLREELPPRVQEVCATAVDPLEIAATLEVCGISNRVARDRFRQPDLFHMAHQLFRSTPFELAPLRKDALAERGGSPSDLGRGVLFAVNSLIFAAAIRGSGTQLSWWTAALALTCGWALSQGVAAAGYSIKNRGRSPNLVVVWGLLVAALVGAGLAMAGVRLLGGTGTTVAVVTTFSVYVTAFGVLLLYEEIRLAAVILAPCVVLSLVYFNGWPSVPGDAVAAAMALTIGVITVAALRHASPRFWRRLRLSRSDWLTIARYVGTGVCSGLAISVIAVLAAHEAQRGALISLAAYPIVITLGVLEWQLRSYRARAIGAMERSPELREFRRLAGRSFLRAFGWYLASLAFVSAVVVGVLVWHHLPVPTALLIADNELGLAFFVGLVMASCFRVDLVLRGWISGVAVFAALILATRALGGPWGFETVEVITVLAATTVLVHLLYASRQVVHMPFSYL